MLININVSAFDVDAFTGKRVPDETDGTCAARDNTLEHRIVTTKENSRARFDWQSYRHAPGGVQPSQGERTQQLPRNKEIEKHWRESRRTHERAHSPHSPKCRR